MPTKHARDLGAATPAGIDDFKIIHGIGPGVESRLHSRGVLTFAQLAALAPAEIAALLADLSGLSAERIVKQDWVGQARELVPEVILAAEPEPESRQRYATFTVELLLDDDDVRRTRIVHIQQEREESWAQWDEARLLSFISQGLHRGTHIAEAPAPLLSVPEEQPPAVAEPAIATADLAPPTHVELPQPIGTPRLQQLALLAEGEDHVNNVLDHNKRYTARLFLDLTGVSAPHGTQLNCTATVYVRRLGGHRTVAGEVSVPIALDDLVAVDVANLALEPGTYRTEAMVALHPHNGTSRSVGMAAIREGGLVQVY
jgi:hypothetical protein